MLTVITSDSRSVDCLGLARVLTVITSDSRCSHVLTHPELIIPYARLADVGTNWSLHVRPPADTAS